MHATVFEYLKPTDEQMAAMAAARLAFAECAEKLAALIPDGPDRTYVIRHLRECAMWANVAVTRNPDGSPRV
jgi:hypothetical protein